MAGGGGLIAGALAATSASRGNMNSVSPSVLRACFKTFLGEEDYRKFLDAGTAGQLRQWQTKAWERFVTAHPSMAMSSQERADALDVCPAHEKALLVGFTESPEGHYFRHPPERKLRFPRAPLMPLTPHGVQRVRYCSECLLEANRHFKGTSLESSEP